MSIDVIKIIDKDEVESLKSLYSNENLFFNNKTKIYFGYYKGGILVGFCGLMILKNKAVLKNGFVVKEERRKGIYKKLNDYRFDYITNTLKIKAIEGNMTRHSLPYHLIKGAKIIKEYKKCTKIRYEV